MSIPVGKYMSQNVPGGQLPSGILPFGSYQLTSCLLKHCAPKFSMDELHKRRIETLKQIRDTEFNGVQAKMAERLGVQADYLSRVLNDRKGLGGDTAREWETKLGKPNYYLDGVVVTEGKLSLASAPPDPSLVNPEQLIKLAQLFCASSPLGREQILDAAESAQKLAVSKTRKASGD
jgi:hypothetical protein